MENYMEGFKKLALKPELLTEISESVGSRTDYPLAPQGIRVYWDTLCNYHGWKLQKNYYYDHCRILDDNNVRRAWGNEKEVLSILKSLS